MPLARNSADQLAPMTPRLVKWADVLIVKARDANWDRRKCGQSQLGDRRPRHHPPLIAVARNRARYGVGGDRRQWLRFRVPFGTLLCVSDKPLHGEIKLAGMAEEFYRQRVGQHLEIGLKALQKLKVQEWARLHSRKLRSFAEVAFQ